MCRRGRAARTAVRGEINGKNAGPRNPRSKEVEKEDVKVAGIFQ